MTPKKYDKDEAILNIGDFSVFEISRTIEQHFIAVSPKYPVLITFSDIWELCNWIAERQIKYGETFGNFWHDGTTDQEYMDKIAQDWGDENWEDFLKEWKEKHLKGVKS